MALERYVALLRGINIGRAKRVSMGDLRALVAGLGYQNVRTLLNSGNVVFDGPSEETSAVGERIGAAVEDACGVSCRVMVVTAEELDGIVRGNTIEHRCQDPSRFLVAFFASRETARTIEPLCHQQWGQEDLAVAGRAAYMWCADGILASALMTAVGRAARDRVTTRNWSTVLKLQAMAQEMAKCG